MHTFLVDWDISSVSLSSSAHRYYSYKDMYTNTKAQAGVDCVVSTINRDIFQREAYLCMYNISKNSNERGMFYMLMGHKMSIICISNIYMCTHRYT